jgi:hypothetical protein
MLTSSPFPLRKTDDEVQDRANYAALTQAVWNASKGSADIADFSYRNVLDMNYDIWAVVRESQDDQYPPNPGALPRRVGGPLNGNLSFVQDAIKAKLGGGNDIDLESCIIIANTLTVAQEFMNMCADVRGIGAPATPGAANPFEAAQQAWNSLNKEVGQILTQDVSHPYLIPVVVALTQQIMSQSPQISFSGPTLPTSKDPGYKLNVEIS